MREKSLWIGFAFGIFVALLITGAPLFSARDRVSELESELDNSYRIVGELRGANQEISIRQQQLADVIERTNKTVVELTDRADRAERLVESTSRELAVAVNEAGSLGEILRGILDIIEKLELTAQAP